MNEVKISIKENETLVKEVNAQGETVYRVVMTMTSVCGSLR